jgi:HEPN domain-containing protein
MSDSRDVDRWLEHAARDMAVARAFGFHPSVRCYHAQQAAEKSLKAVLVHHDIVFPFTHNLDVLRNLAPSSYGSARAFPDLGWLTDWATTARYPGEQEDATEQDASRALELASAIVSFVQSALADRQGGES